jgi:hypothetical protein
MPAQLVVGTISKVSLNTEVIGVPTNGGDAERFNITKYGGSYFCLFFQKILY